MLTNVIERFVDSPDDDKSTWLEKHGIYIFLIFMKLVFIYIVMVLWPKVMPKIIPSINKQPGYISLLGLSVILSLL
tara:strand:- start:985 stop:1212 length:228 start_codon:yes stop_codon:yes gene_type:complete